MLCRCNFHCFFLHDFEIDSRVIVQGGFCYGIGNNLVNFGDQRSEYRPA